MHKVQYFRWCLYQWYKEGAALNWCLRTVVLEKTPESPLDSKEIKPVNLKGNKPWILVGNQPWILVARTEAEAETPVFWSSDGNSWLTGNVPEAWKRLRAEEKRASEDAMAGWHHRCNGHELGQTLEDCKGQGGLACCKQSVGLQRVKHNWATEQQQYQWSCDLS